jgi:hypothetical protein
MFMPWTGAITQYGGPAWWREFCTFLFAHGWPMFNPESPRWQMFTLLPLGITAPFGTIILGWIAVSQIRRSAGKLYGMGLAVFDGLFFPLLALDAVIFGFVWLVIRQFFRASGGDMLTIGYQIGWFFAVWLGVATLVSVVMDWFIIRRIWHAVKKPVVVPVPPVPKPDYFWRWFAVVVLAMISIPILISIVGLLAAIAIPNFVRARAQAQENARHAAEMLAARNASPGATTDFYIGQTHFPHGDSIEITSVERGENRMTVKGHYNLASADEASLWLNITATNNDEVPNQAASPHNIHISKGRGDFELSRSHLEPGLPYVSMYNNHHSFAGVYFGNQAEAAEASKLDLGYYQMPDGATVPNLSFGPVVERVIQPLVHRAINLASGNFVEPGPGRLLDFSPEGTNSLRAGGVDLYWQVGGPAGVLTMLDMRLYVGLYPQHEGETELTFAAITGDQVRAVLSNAENWRSNMKPLMPGLDLWRATGNITGTNVYLFVTRNDVQGVLQITDVNPRGVKLRYKLVQNQAAPNREPSYHGKTLLEWLTDFDCGPQLTEKGGRAREAIRQMGTNVIPFLLTDLGGGNPLQVKYDKQDTRLADDRMCQAVWAFDALGSDGRIAIPQLEKLLEVNPGYVPGALAGIGRDALPELLKALTNDVFWVRNNTAAYLANAIYRGKISGYEAIAAWPIAYSNLTYTNATNNLYEANTRARAASLLDAIRSDPVISSLPDPRSPVK